jgi:hypothetical protein
MSPEELFARRICRVLDEETEVLDPSVIERLRAARERALTRQPIEAHENQIVGAGGTARLGRFGHHGDERGHPWRTLLAILMLVIGMSIAYYWNSFAQADENEQIDSALLADELPPKAYLDPGFQAWLSHYAQSAR